MLKKRLVGVITVKDGWAVQSFGYRRYLPLGKPEHLAENLDRWGADEILVQTIDRSTSSLGPDFDLLRRLGSLGLSTPLTYAGGVGTAAQAAKAIQFGAERVCVDSMLHDRPCDLRSIAELVGTQAVIASLPICIEEGELRWYNYRARQTREFSEPLMSLFAEGAISEAFVVDWRHEGSPRAFNLDLIERFPIKNTPIIAFGGISDAEQLSALFDRPQIVAAGIGNFLNYAEHTIQNLKRRLIGAPIRPAEYRVELSQ